MKNTKIILGIIIIITAIGIFVEYKKNPINQTEIATVCTMDAKVCPDGSYVGREGPKCEFKACPNITTSTTTKVVNPVVGKGTLKGQVSIGPVCPVEMVGYPCEPTSEMYAAAKVFVYLTDKKTLVTTITPDEKGNFSITLSAGTYFIDMIHQRIGGTKGVPVTITIISGKTVVLNLDVDTGLR